MWSEVDYNAFPDWSNTNDRSQAGTEFSDIAT